jgi:hypothetical protein
MNFGRITVGAVVGTIAYYVVGTIFAAFFSNLYQPYETVFRSRTAIMTYLPYGLAGTLVAMFIAAMIYAWAYRGGRALAGLQFGALMGLFLIFDCVVHDYVIVNVGLKVELVEGLTQFFGWALAGAVIGLAYRPAARSEAK